MSDTSSVYIEKSYHKIFHLDAPILNISAYTREDSRLAGHNASGVLSAIWTRGNETFDSKYILSNGKCQNTGAGRLQFILENFGTLLNPFCRTTNGVSRSCSCSSASYSWPHGLWVFTSCGYIHTTPWLCATASPRRSPVNIVQFLNWQLL